MKNLPIKAGTAMSCLHENVSCSKPVRTCLWGMAVLLSGFLATAQPTQAQLTTVSISDFYHEINDISMSGDTLKFEFTLGNPEVPAEDVAGFAVQFGFPNLNAAPHAVLTCVAGTWLAAGQQNPTASSSYHATDKRLEVSFVRADEQGVTGYGTVLHVDLVRTGGFTDEEATVVLVDGIVMIDNVNMRVAQGQEQGVNQSAANQATQLDIFEKKNI